MVVRSTGQGSKPSTPENRSWDSGPDLSSDGDSGGSLFITQSAAKKVQRRKSTAQKQSKSKKSSLKQDEFLRKWDVLGDFISVPSRRITKAKSKPKSSPRKRFVTPKKAVFPFLLKTQKNPHLSLPKHQVLENSEIGGFFKCMKKIQTSNVPIPKMLEFVPSDDLEEENSDNEISVVNKGDFVLNKIKQKWLTQSILSRRVQDAQDENLQNQTETFEVLAECTDSELSDWDWSEQDVVRCDEVELADGQMWVVEETQRLTQAVHKDARINTECSSSHVTKGGEVSEQNLTQHENGTGDLEGTVLFMHDSDLDSDVTLIDADVGKCVSKSGPATPKGKIKNQGCLKADNETTQPSTRSISTSPAPPLLFKDEQGNANIRQSYESQDASQSLLNSHVKLVPESEEINSQKKRKKSFKNVLATEAAAVLEEDTVIHPASEPVCKPAVEMSDSPLFKHGHNFLQRKKKGKKGSESIHHETNVNVGGVDITGLAHKDKRKSGEVEDTRTDEEKSSDTKRLSGDSDSTDILQVKKKKDKKQKLEEPDNATPSGETQDFQDNGLVSKKSKKKRKSQKKTENQDDTATCDLSNGNLENAGKSTSRLSGSSQSEKTSEFLETSNDVASVNATNKKKKKQQVKSQDVGPDTQQSVETVQHNDSLLSLKITKKEKAERLRSEEDNDETLEHVVEAEKCSTPSVTVLRSVKKRIESEQSPLDVCSVSQAENGSMTQEVFNDTACDECLQSDMEDTLNDPKLEKKKKKEDRSDLSSHVTQSEETPERRKKKKKKIHSDGLIEGRSELHTDSGNSQSLVSPQSERRSKKKRDEEGKEADESPVSRANVNTEESNAEKQVDGHSGGKIKKRKKDVNLTDSNIEMISVSHLGQSDTPTKPKKNKKTRCDDEATTAETVLPLDKVKDRQKEGKLKKNSETVSVMEDNSEIQNNDVSLKKEKKKRKSVKVSITDTVNSLIHSEPERTEALVQNDDELPKIKKKKRKSIAS